MIKIEIDGSTKSGSEITEKWIRQAFGGSSQSPPCVRITINGPDCHVPLATAACGHNGPGGRPPSDCESEVLEIWSRNPLSTADYTHGNLIAFWKQIKDMI